MGLAKISYLNYSKDKVVMAGQKRETRLRARFAGHQRPVNSPTKDIMPGTSWA